MKNLQTLLVILVLLCLPLTLPQVRSVLVGRFIAPALTPRATKYAWDSKVVLGEFYMKAQAKDYAGAHLLLSTNLQRSGSVQTLTQQWQAFEQKHGAIKGWKPARGGTIGGDRTSVWPAYVDFSHIITGSKRGTGKVIVRMVPEQGTWRVDKLSITP